MIVIHKDDADGVFTVSELIAWLKANCAGDEHCTGVDGCLYLMLSNRNLLNTVRQEE